MDDELSGFQKTLRITIVVVFACLFVAVLVVPSYVPEPKMILKEMPQSMVMGDDLTFTVQVNAWQGNFWVEQAVIIANHPKSTCGGEHGLFDRITIENPQPSFRSPYATLLGRIPFPRKTEYRFTAGLGETASTGLLSRGRLTGVVFVSWCHETLQKNPHRKSPNRSVELRLFKNQHTSLAFAVDIR